MKGFVYLRRSSDDGKDAIELQQDAINAWAERKAITDLRIFSDDGIEGGSINNRPGFCDLLEVMKSDPRNFLAIFDENRIGRFKDRVERAEVVKTFTENLKSIYVVDEDDETHYDMTKEEDADSLEDQLTEARKENRRRGRFIRKGVRRKMKKGNYSAGRQPLTATWDKANEKWIPVDTEVAALKKAAELIKEGHGLNTIAKILNDNPTEYTLRQWGKKERKWTSQTLWSIFCRSDFLFTGEIISRKNNLTIKTKIITFTKAEIDDLRNRIKHRNKRKGGKLQTWNFLLRGLAICGECDKAWTLSVQGIKTKYGTKLRYYRCKNCGTGFKANEIEGEIRRKVAKRLGNKEKILWLIKKQCFIPQSKLRNLEDELAIIDAELTKIWNKKKIAKEMRLDLDLTKAEFKDRKKKLDKIEAPLRIRKNAIENTLNNRDGMMEGAEKIAEELVKRVRALYYRAKSGQVEYQSHSESRDFVVSEMYNMNEISESDFFEQEHEFYRWIISLDGSIKVKKEGATIDLNQLESLLDEPSFTPITDIDIGQATFG